MMGKCVFLEALCKYPGPTLPKREEGTAAISRLSGSCHAPKAGVKITSLKKEGGQNGDCELTSTLSLEILMP